MTLYVGCCGFCAARSRYYGMFNVVELQETFYDLPEPERLRGLASEAPQGFVFAMKAWQGITHTLDSPTWRRAKRAPPRELADRYGHLRPTREVLEGWERTAEAARALGAKVVVVQSPPSFGYSEENYRNAVDFFSVVDVGHFTIGWEPRGTWLQHKDKVAEIVSRFRGVVHVVDPFRGPPAVLKEVVYLRLHGIGPREVNYGYKYKDEDLSALCSTVRELLGRAREVYVLFNNVHMLQDAARFKELCGSRPL